jgi:hypothetical protein
VDWKVGYVLAVPVLLALFAAPDFFFDPPGWLDPFVYVGYFRHYAEHLPLFDEYYKASRLPWVLPGFVSFRLFGPVAGTYVLQLGTLSFGLACLYGALRDSLDAGAALLATALLGTCTWFHGSGGWNYHMGVTAAYFLAAVWCLNRAAAGGRAPAWYFLAGAALGLTVHTHLFMAAFGPGLVVHYVLSCRSAWRRLSLADVPAGLAGAAAVTGALCLVNRCSGGTWLFFLPQVQYTLALSRSGNYMHLPPGAWLPLASWLALPAAAVLSCPLAWLLGRPGAGGRGLMVLSYQAQCLLAAGACCYCQFVKKQTILQPDYMAVALLGPAVLALAAFLHSVRDRFAGVSAHRVALVGLALFVVPLLAAFQIGRWLPGGAVRVPSVPVLRDWPLLLPVALTVTGVAVIALRRRSAAGWLAGLALVSAGNVVIHRPAGNGMPREMLRFIAEADRFTTRLDPTLTDIKYWFDYQETIGTPGRPAKTFPLFDSYVATRGWMGNLLGGSPVPDAPRIEARHLAGVRRLGVLSATANQEKYVAGLRARLAELGYALRPQAERSFRHGCLDLTLGVYWVEKRAGPRA